MWHQIPTVRVCCILIQSIICKVVKCKVHQTMHELALFHSIAVIERYQLTTRKDHDSKTLLFNMEGFFFFRFMSCYHFIPALCVMLLCVRWLWAFFGKKAGFICFGKNPRQATSPGPKASREPLAGSQNSSRRGNYCLGDPEIQGQLCFNKPGNVPPL